MDFKTLQNIEVEGIDMKDYPKFCDAYIAFAEHADGSALTDIESVSYTHLRAHET